MEKHKGTIPAITLTAVFIIGNAVINLPFSEYPEGVIIGFIASIILGYVFICFYEKGIKKAENSKAVSIFFALYCMLCSVVTARNFITFSDRVLLPEISVAAPCLAFVLLLYFLCRQEKKLLFKISVTSAVIIFISCSLLFLFSAESIKPSAFLTFKITDIKGILYEALAFLSMSFLQTVILIYFLKEERDKSSVKKGYILGATVLLICFIQSIGVLGVSLTGRLINPYAYSVSIISLGQSSVRLEGFSYFLYFSASLIKSAVCVVSGSGCIGKISKKAGKYWTLINTVIIGIFCIFTSLFKNISFIYIAPFLALPPIYFLFRQPR